MSLATTVKSDILYNDHSTLVTGVFNGYVINGFDCILNFALLNTFCCIT